MGVTVDTKSLDQVEHSRPDLTDVLPAARYHFAPSGVDSAAEILAAATDERAVVTFHGTGTKQGVGGEVHPDVVVSTAGLDRIVRWEPDDLTLVVEPGARVRDVEAELASRGQTAGLPEWDGAGTVGGVIATGVSGYRRARLGPTRDRMLEVSIVTGDGRIVKGGGRVVKNVTGYDLPRLATGSMGRLGMIASVCFKLWPLPEASATVPVPEPAMAWRRLYRPLAVLETEAGSWAYVQGTRAEVRAEAATAGGVAEAGHRWPQRPVGAFECTARVMPSDLAGVVERLTTGWRYVAQHGVGLVDAATDEPDADAVGALRRWVEQRGGALVITRRGSLDIDPWGRPPAGLELQRRVIAGFDPYGICNPGRLPGGV